MSKCIPVLKYDHGSLAYSTYDLGLDIDVNKYMGHLELTDISKKSVSFHGNYGDIK